MSINIGVITYDSNHLKTEEVILNFVNNEDIQKIKLFSLPFIQRDKRQSLFNHRPDMSLGAHTRELALLPRVEFNLWDGMDNLSSMCDFFVITGAGIIDPSFASGKPIINLHPGIIPLARGLDAFKWSILNNYPLGNSLHLIDEEVDKGKILTIKKTPVFPNDTIEQLAKRHYLLEINLLSNCLNFMESNFISDYNETPPKRRMKNSDEEEMIKNFDKWKNENSHIT